MIKYIFYFSICLAANPLDQWIDEHEDILKQEIKSVSFHLTFDSEIYSTWNDSIISGKITVGKKKQFRFEMGPRTVVSDGKVWKSYDERTNQIFIQEPDKKLEKALFSWVKVNKLKALSVKDKPDGSYKIQVFGNNNDVRTYFNSATNILDSILIKPRNGLRSIIFNISISAADSVFLDIGTKSSELFDLR